MGGHQTSLNIHPNLATFTITTCRAAKGLKQTLDFLPLDLPTNPSHPRLHLARRQRTSPIPQTCLTHNTATLQSSPSQQPQQSQTPNQPHPALPPHNHPLSNKRPNQSLGSSFPRNPALRNPPNSRTHQRRANIRDMGRSLRAPAQSQNQSQDQYRSKLTASPETHPSRQTSCCLGCC